MSLSNYTVVFDTVLGSPTEGTIAVSAIVPSGVTADFYLEIIDPTLATIKSTNTAGAAELSGGNATLDFPVVDLPIDSRGAYLKGTYVINVYVKNQDSGGGPASGIITDTKSYSFCPISSQANPNVPTLTGNVNCLTGKLVVTDTTNIEGLSIADYLLTVTPPTVPGVILSGGTTTQKSLTISLSYTNVSYTASIQGTGTRETTDGDFVVTELLSMVGFITIPIECNSLCDLLTCAQEALAEYEVKAAAVGGLGKLSADDLTAYLKITSLMSQLGAASICNACDLESIVTSLKDLVGCDCGCGDSNVPMRLVTLCSGLVSNEVPSLSQLISGSGTVTGDKKIIYWSAIDSDVTPMMMIDVEDMLVDEVYEIVVSGNFVGDRTIHSADANIVYPIEPALVADFVFACEATSVFILKMIFDGTSVFIEQAPASTAIPSQSFGANTILDPDADVIFWDRSAGAPAPSLLGINMSNPPIVNKVYKIFVTGTFVGNRTIYTTGSQNIIAGNGYPSLANSETFITGGSGVICKQLVYDGTYIFIQSI